MKGRFKYEKMSEYPHLAPNDKVLWEWFMETHPNEYESVDYDMHVGEGVAPPLDTPPNEYTDNMAHLTKKRVDVCGYRKDGSIDCIEVRPRAGSSAIGAVVVNTELLAKLTPDSRRTPLIITDRAQADMVECCRLFGIRLIELDRIT